MILFFSINKKEFVNASFKDEVNPLTGSKGIRFIVWQKYMAALYGAFAPVGGKQVTAYGLDDNQPIPITMWTPSMQQKAEICKKEAKGTWKLFMVPITLVLFFAIFIGGMSIYRTWANESKAQDLAMQDSYRANPQVGDIIYGLYIVRENGDGQQKEEYGAAFKVLGIDGDTLLTAKTKQKFDMLANNVWDLSKATDKFDTSDKAFAEGHQLKFSKKQLERAALVTFKNASAEDREGIANVQFIERPKQ